jgi:hypothetical protein
VGGLDSTTKKSNDFLSSRSDNLSDVKIPISDQGFRVPEVAGHLTRDRYLTRDRSGAPDG